jgi:predicted ATPase
MQLGLAASRRIGVGIGLPNYLTLLAEMYLDGDQADKALVTVTEAMALAVEQSDHSREAEIQRIKGEVLLRQEASDVSEAGRCFDLAILVARNQHAKSFELRATTSLARLLASQDRRGEARTMLAEIYNWFTEGFDTADLKDAKALLDELGA